MSELRNLLGIVQEADTPEERDQAWDEIEARYAAAVARAEQAERERDEALTQLHGARWVMGLEHHEGEDTEGGLIQERDSLALRVGELETALRGYDAWASMYLTLNSTLRWNWWRLRPFEAARAALAGDKS